MQPPRADLYWAQMPVYHHHPDGTVHAHVRGEELHSHAPDGMLRLGFRVEVSGFKFQGFRV